MARSTIRFDAIDRDLRIAFPELASEAERAKMLIDFAKEERNKALAQNKAALGYMPDYETRVDGSPARVEMAKSTSTIEFEFELATQMYQWIEDMLIINSPVGKENDPRPNHPELYARSHAFFIDGVRVDPSDPVRMPREEAVFVNLQPYARKIERGLSQQQPDGVYQVVAIMAQERFGNYARIRFGYRTPQDIGAIHEWANTTRMQTRRRNDRAEWLRRQPAIVITL